MGEFVEIPTIKDILDKLKSECKIPVQVQWIRSWLSNFIFCTCIRWYIIYINLCNKPYDILPYFLVYDIIEILKFIPIISYQTILIPPHALCSLVLNILGLFIQSSPLHQIFNQHWIILTSFDTVLIHQLQNITSWNEGSKKQWWIFRIWYSSLYCRRNNLRSTFLHLQMKIMIRTKLVTQGTPYICPFVKRFHVDFL